MKGKTAGLVFLVVCAILAGLLLTSAINPPTGGFLFALTLASLGILSRAFRKT